MSAMPVMRVVPGILATLGVVATKLHRALPAATLLLHVLQHQPACVAVCWQLVPARVGAQVEWLRAAFHTNNRAASNINMGMVVLLFSLLNTSPHPAGRAVGEARAWNPAAAGTR